MTTSAPAALPDPRPRREGPAAGLPDAVRGWLAGLADLLIPASAPMPAASAVGVATDQLDVVLRARPDLARGLLRAWSATADLPPEEAVVVVPELDPEGWDAVRLAVAGGYYTHPRVRQLLGYDGQQPRAVQVAEDIDLDLLERVVERGPRYRPA
jgi:hypothetical protein